MCPAPSGGSAREIPFGAIGRPHGISGELHLRPFNPGGLGLDRLSLPLTVTLGGPGESTSFVIRSVRRVGAGYLVVFEGVASRDDAARLTGREVRVSITEFPPLRGAEFYVEDLADCLVKDMAGNVLGKVTGTFWNGAHDVMVLNGGERLIPIVPEFIVAVDAPNRIATVDLHE